MSRRIVILVAVFSLNFFLLGSQTRAAEEMSDKETNNDIERLPNADKLQEAMGQVSEQLQKERQELEEEKKRLETLRSEVKSDLKKLEKLYDDIINLQKNAKKLGGVEQEQEEQNTEPPSELDQQERINRIRHIAKSLSSMSPKAAAITIGRMNDNLAVEILRVVNSRKMGKIFEAMEASRAAALMQKVINANKWMNRRKRR